MGREAGRSAQGAAIGVRPALPLPGAAAAHLLALLLHDFSLLLGDVTHATEPLVVSVRGACGSPPGRE